MNKNVTIQEKEVLVEVNLISRDNKRRCSDSSTPVSAFVFFSDCMVFTQELGRYSLIQDLQCEFSIN